MEYDKKILYCRTRIDAYRRNKNICTNTGLNEEIDTYVDDIIDAMNDNDLLIITADHGCDPTVPGTDHTREYVPILIFHKNGNGENLGMLKGFDYIADRIKDWLEI